MEGWPLVPVTCIMEEPSITQDDFLTMCSARDTCESPGEESPFEVDDKDEISVMISAVEQRHKVHEDKNSMKEGADVITKEEAKMESDGTGNVCQQVTRFDGKGAKEHALQYLTQLSTNCTHITIKVECKAEPGENTPETAMDNSPNMNGPDTKENSPSQCRPKTEQNSPKKRKLTKKMQKPKKRRLTKKMQKKGEYECDLCGNIYGYASNLSRHRATHTHSFTCEHCGTTFKRNDYLKDHLLKSKKCKSTSVIVLK